ncbi:hypothetical protein TCAL_01653 [Tigriopus californicus]|uniref:Armadillo repeat-containing domain-containing protein n=2 Tax=Tigriopus californicus TaxID=6832 RepID=A0A553PC89_TIGCA|nr:hypothetical protein TCAL_01653 [Tigriopus californicus]|eukprot:TCALIF_01653-PA protein Name:"Similar to ARMC2 Armadillo repeat-containing protein 2 (Homo sapiens)" AED:0.12 eAED:0.12 QI:0/-1/0/1/-1/1/1/0/741
MSTRGNSRWTPLPPMAEDKIVIQKQSSLTNFPLRPLKTKRPFTPRDRHWNHHGHNADDPLSLVGTNVRISLPSVKKSLLRLESSRKSSTESLGSMRLPAILESDPQNLRLTTKPKRQQFRALQAAVPHENEEVDNILTASRKFSFQAQVRTTDRNNDITTPGHSLTEIQDCLHRVSSADCQLTLLEELRQLAKMLSLIKADTQQRRAIYSTLSPLVQHESSAVLIALLDVLLLLKLSRINLTMVAKILFHVASSERNDEELHAKAIVTRFFHAISESCPVTDGDLMIYGYGALKFVSFNRNILKDLVNQGLMDVLVLHLQILSHHIEELNEPTPNELINEVFQISACLRNALDVQEGRNSFMKLDGPSLLARLVDQFKSDPEIMCNMSRILSLLSLCDDNAHEALNHNDQLISNILELIDSHRGRPELIVRLAFSLGNFAAKYQESRRRILNHGNMLTTLPEVMSQYANQTIQSLKERPTSKVLEKKSLPSNSGAGDTTDTLIKLIRVYANTSIDAECGEKIALNDTVVQTLIKLAEASNQIKCEELALPTLATLNNLSFYPVLHHEEIFEQIILFIDRQYPEPIALEAVRVLGNLSRHPQIRAKLRSNDHLIRVISQWSGATGSKLQFPALGILVNLMTDAEFRAIFRLRNGTSLLIGQLRRIQQTQDYALGSLLCQCLWNYCIDADDPIQLLGKRQLDALEQTLIGLLDLDAEEDPNVSPTYAEFSSVGFYLLSKLCSE